MERRRFLAAVGGGMAISTAGCGGVGGETNADVVMTASRFDPKELTVDVGESVVWENTSSRAHTVTAYEDGIPDGADYWATGGYESEAAAREAWKSDLGGALESGDTFEHTFEVAGTHQYFCVPHEKGGMVGVIDVEG